MVWNFDGEEDEAPARRKPVAVYGISDADAEERRQMASIIRSQNLIRMSDEWVRTHTKQGQHAGAKIRDQQRSLLAGGGGTA